MKKLVLFTFVFFGLISKTFSKNSSYTYYEQPISFTDSNVSFAVYKNGAFDFYIDRVAGFHINLNTPAVSLSFNSGYNYSPYVQYDRYGAVVQVENIPIFYDYYGRVSRIGSVNIHYYNGWVSRVGGLRIYYNNHGAYTHYSGYINRYNRHFVHVHNHYFHYPKYDYLVVSHKPYRKHYRPQRYTYYENHKKNHYYKKKNHRQYAQNSGNHKSEDRRRATQEVPKNRDNYNRMARRSGNNQAKELFRGEPIADESYFRNSSRTRSANEKTYRSAESKKTRDRKVRKEPIQRNGMDLFNEKRPERIAAVEKNNKNKRSETKAQKSEPRKPEHYSRSRKNTNKMNKRD